MLAPTKRSLQLAERQKMVLASLQQGHRAVLQMSPLSGRFTGHVRVFNASRNVDELLPWCSMSAMIRRGLVELDEDSFETSTAIVLRQQSAEGVEGLVT
ncbi:hypothetical protein [Cupriavidus pauculus]|uniref:hypothetical protein n=1 Tax=Cupriavidus pauculus TaxID=82633 RepID=UPI001FCFAA87|nr:hypothetical protein [Cupriavidus pauculus]